MRMLNMAVLGVTVMALCAGGARAVDQGPPPGKQGGMLMGPPVSMIRNVPLGKELDVSQTGGMSFSVYNRGSDALTVKVFACKPQEGGLGAWERGYEPVPDTGWFRLEPAVVTLPTQQAAKIKLFINIPNKPEYANRKFMLGVLTKPAAGAGFGAGLALCARVMLETEARPDTDGARAGAIAVTPAVVRFSGVPAGAHLAGKFSLRNNTAQEQTYVMARYQQVYKDSFRDEREPRYLSDGYQFVPPAGWATTEKHSWTLKAGESVEVQLKANVPATATPGSKHEELLFIGDKKTMEEVNAETAEKKLPQQPALTFVRVQYEVAK